MRRATPGREAQPRSGRGRPCPPEEVIRQGLMRTDEKFHQETGKIRARYGRDTGGIQAGYGRDAGEMRARYGRDMGEILARYGMYMGYILRYEEIAPRKVSESLFHVRLIYLPAAMPRMCKLRCVCFCAETAWGWVVRGSPSDLGVALDRCRNPTHPTKRTPAGGGKVTRGAKLRA